MVYQLYVFGSNGEGQLGIPAEEIVNTPTIAKLNHRLGNIKAICGGDNHTLFLTESGDVWATGDNRKSQLGHAVFGGTRSEEIEKLYDGMDYCAATCESSAYIANFAPNKCSAKPTLLTEGTSHWGELGLLDITSTVGLSRVNQQQTLPYSVINFAAGGWHYVAILADGSVYGWGKSRLDQLGPKLSTQQRITKPAKIEEEFTFTPVKVVCGKEFTYLVSDPSDGRHHLLGRDKFSLRTSMPTNVKGWKQIDATWHAIFVLFDNGKLIAWGKENMWKLIPDGLPPIAEITVGSDHVLAVTGEGKLISWGWGKHGNCGNLTTFGDEIRNDMVDGFWNVIEIPGKVRTIGAGFCTSFALIEQSE